MDRSNSIASTSSSTSSISRASSKASTTGLTSYQERLLERTSSLSRTGTQNRGIFTPPTAGPAPARRWAPSHRVSASVDTARVRGEFRGEEQHEGDPPPLQAPNRPMSSAVEDILRRHATSRNPSTETSRTTISSVDHSPSASDDPQFAIPRPPSRTVEDILRRHDLLKSDASTPESATYSRTTEPSTAPALSSNAAQAASIIAKSRSTPPFIKRRTLPEPIAVTSYLLDDSQPPTSPPATPQALSLTPTPASPTRTFQRRTADRPEPATLGRTFRTPAPAIHPIGDQPLETATLGRRFGASALSSHASPDLVSGRFPPANDLSGSQPAPEISHSPERTQTLATRRSRSQSVEILAQAEAARNNHTFESSTPTWVHSRGSLRRTGGVGARSSSPSKRSPASQSPVRMVVPTSPSKTGEFSTEALPQPPYPVVIPSSPVKDGFAPTSPIKSSFNLPAAGKLPPWEPTRADNEPVSGSTTLKRNKYGPALSAGRRLGRHLPRIASGDAGDDWEEPRAKSSEEVAKEKREQEREERRKQLEEKSEREREARERRRTLQGLNMEEEFPPPLPASAALAPTPNAPAGADDVAGIPGRLRFTRDTVPMPSSRLIGNWADSQRKHLQAYEYLCHVGEAQQWIEGCLGMELGFGVVEMDEGLRNGVVLARLAKVIGEAGEGDVVRKIFEVKTLAVCWITRY